ncbi:MAG TPA: histidine--tRNA ligase [Verrucomicrobiae bacterium]|nr:histidine--tRNA ligase [Verrucomicrobiae bacterium]
MAKFQSVRGFNDVLPADAAAWQFVHECAAQVFAAYGYGEVRLPLLERTELYQRAIGEVTDVVEKEMFTFKDRENDSLTLRPEFTAGVVRAGLEQGLLHNQQQRLWCAGPVFRHERPQAGRYRQFHQFNVEAYGMAGPDIDVEVIAISARLLRRLGLAPHVTLELNSLGTLAARTRYRAALIEFLRSREDRLDENSRRRLDANPMRALDSKDPGTLAAVADAPSLLDYLDEESRVHFDAVRAGLDALGIAYRVNPRIVRGLDYYSRTVFEWTTDKLGAQGTVLAGGRYDGLVEMLGGSPTAAIGWAAGIERLILLLKQAGTALPDIAPHVYLCSAGENTQAAGAALAERLRDTLPSLRLVLNAAGGKLPAQLKRADKSGARLALILGDAEAARQSVQVKSLRDSSQAECTWDELPSRLAALLQP